MDRAITRFLFAVGVLGVFGGVLAIFADAHAQTPKVFSTPASCSGVWSCLPSFGVPTALQKPMNLYVSGTGSDFSQCTVPGAPCKTIQGAVNKIPKLVTYPVEIYIDGGTYTGAWVEGFTFNRTATTTDGGAAWIRFNGQLINATVGTGPNVAVATTGTRGAWSDETVNTVGVADAGWPDGGLVDDLITFTSGGNSGNSYPIIANTFDTIYFTDHPGTVPAAGMGFSVQTWGTTVNGDLPYWQVPSKSGSDTYLAHHFSFVFMSTGETENISIKGIHLPSTSFSLNFTPLWISRNSSVSLVNVLQDGADTFGSWPDDLAQLNIIDSILKPRNNVAAIDIQIDAAAVSPTGLQRARVSAIGNFVHGQTAGGNNGWFVRGDRVSIGSKYNYFSDLQRMAAIGGGNIFDTFSIYKNVQQAYALSGGNFPVNVGSNAGAYIDSCYYDTVTTALQWTGSGAFYVDHTNGTGVGTGIACKNGCLQTITANTGFGTASTTDIALDTANYSFATLRAASPTMEVDAKWGSRVVQ